MMMTIEERSRSATGAIAFLGLLIIVYSVDLTIAGRMPAPRIDAGIVAAAVIIDLTIVVPTAFHFLVARRRRLPILAVVPLVMLGFWTSSVVLPSDQQRLLTFFELFLVPAEFLFLLWMCRRATAAFKSAQSDASSDPIRTFQKVLLELSGLKSVSRLVATEVAMFYYAIGSWRSEPHVPSGSTAIFHHVRSGHGGMVFGLLLVTAAEALAVHFLLLDWNETAAWIVTILSVYGALWLIGDYRAAVLRPILINGDSLLIRAGLRYSAVIPVAQVRHLAKKAPENVPDALSMVFLGTPTHWISLSQAVTVEGPYGIRRSASVIGVAPDDISQFEQLIGSVGN